jgi:hypothetical protein
MGNLKKRGAAFIPCLKAGVSCRKTMNPHKGSSLRSLFQELGEWDEVEALAQKKIVAEALRRQMEKGKQ